MTLGNKIMTLRAAARISQEELAEKLGVSRQSVSKWEMDQSVPMLDKVLMICELFSVSCDTLLREDTDVYGDEPGKASAVNQPSEGNKYFGTDGLRGKANEDLTFNLVYKVGNALTALKVNPKIATLAPLTGISALIRFLTMDSATYFPISSLMRRPERMIWEWYPSSSAL